MSDVYNGGYENGLAVAEYWIKRTRPADRLEMTRQLLHGSKKDDLAADGFRCGVIDCFESRGEPVPPEVLELLGVKLG